MRRSVLALIVLATACTSAEERCRDVAARHAGGPRVLDEAWIGRCVREGWSERKAECMARTGGLDALFCD